jgi:hypothetical protein
MVVLAHRRAFLRDQAVREGRMSSRTVFVAAVLVANLPLPIQAHDIYSHLRDEAGAAAITGIAALRSIA